MKRFYNKVKQGNLVVVYDNSGTHDSGNVRMLLTPTIFYPLCWTTAVPIKLDMGFIGNQPVLVMFDTRANVTRIHQNLVPKAAYICKYVNCRTFSGQMEQFPLRQMFIRTLYYSG